MINGNRRRIKMGKKVATEYISLDGVVEAPGGFEDSSTPAGASRSTAERSSTGSSSKRP
jgi:hypothetical protein